MLWDYISIKGKITVKNTNTRSLNNTLLNNQEIPKEIKEEIKKYLQTNDNENMTTQNLCDAAKAVLRWKFIAIWSYLKKKEKSQINNLTLHVKQLEKEEQKDNTHSESTQEFNNHLIGISKKGTGKNKGE